MTTEAQPAEPPWLAIARAELGVRELPGRAANPRILAYFEATKLEPSGDETPWCAAYVGWCLEQAGIKGTGRANARSYLEWGTRLLTPRVGCIAVFSRPPDKLAGHVGFYLRTNMATRIELLGGNQGDAVSVMSYPESRLIGFRWPEGVP